MAEAMRCSEDSEVRAPEPRLLQAIKKWKFGFPFPPILVALCGKIAFKKWVAHRKSGFCFSDNPLKTSGLPPPPVGSNGVAMKRWRWVFAAAGSQAAFLRRPLPDLAESEL